jgi:hypothetical protein
MGFIRGFSQPTHGRLDQRIQVRGELTLHKEVSRALELQLAGSRCHSKHILDSMARAIKRGDKIELPPALTVFEPGNATPASDAIPKAAPIFVRSHCCCRSMLVF